jgi:hypothetical protein
LLFYFYFRSKLTRNKMSVRWLARGWTALLSMSSRSALGLTEPPIQLIIRALSPGVRRQRREADHSRLTRAEVKKTWVNTSNPHTPSWRSAYLVSIGATLPSQKDDNWITKLPLKYHPVGTKHVVGLTLLNIRSNLQCQGVRGIAAEALCYRSKGHEFDSWWGHLIFQLT